VLPPHGVRLIVFLCSRCPRCDALFSIVAPPERSAGARAGADPPRVRGEGARVGAGDVGPEERGVEAARRDGRHAEGTARPARHEAGTRARDRRLPQAAGE